VSVAPSGSAVVTLDGSVDSQGGMCRGAVEIDLVLVLGRVDCAFWRSDSQAQRRGPAGRSNPRSSSGTSTHQCAVVLEHVANGTIASMLSMSSAVGVSPGESSGRSRATGGLSMVGILGQGLAVRAVVPLEGYARVLVGAPSCGVPRRLVG
jgi:hypothetical protein